MTAPTQQAEPSLTRGLSADPWIAAASAYVTGLLEKARADYVGRDVIRLTNDRFRGRRARITGVILWESMRGGAGLSFLAQPYRLAGEGDPLLWDEDEARQYVPAALLSFADEPQKGLERAVTGIVRHMLAACPEVQQSGGER